jgi:hypothetical protein
MLVDGSFSRARTFEAWWSASRTTWLFVALVLAVAAAVSLSGKLDFGRNFDAEPSAWLKVALGGSAVIWLVNGYSVAVRLGHTNGLDRAYNDSLLGSAGRHPSDLIAAVEETASKEPGNNRKWFKMGSWDPIFTEHQNLAAGEFKLSLQGETAIVFSGYAAGRTERGAALMGVAIGLHNSCCNCSLSIFSRPLILGIRGARRPTLRTFRIWYSVLCYRRLGWWFSQSLSGKGMSLLLILLAHSASAAKALSGTEDTDTTIVECVRLIGLRLRLLPCDLHHSLFLRERRPPSNASSPAVSPNRTS